MKNYVCISIFVTLLMGCASDSPTTSTSQVRFSESTIHKSNKDSGLFLQFFNSEELEAISIIKSSFEQELCKNRNYTDISKCYDFHSWLLRSNLLQNSPISTFFPYNGSFELDSELITNKLSGVWTNKCGLQTDETTIHYFCIDANKKVMDYLKEVGKENAIIQRYTEVYAEKKGVSPSEIKGIVMGSPEELNFKNFDHQVFYVLFHISLSEEQRAARQLASQ